MSSQPAQYQQPQHHHHLQHHHQLNHPHQQQQQQQQQHNQFLLSKIDSASSSSTSFNALSSAQSSVSALITPPERLLNNQSGNNNNNGNSAISVPAYSVADNLVQGSNAGIIGSTVNHHNYMTLNQEGTNLNLLNVSNNNPIHAFSFSSNQNLTDPNLNFGIKKKSKKASHHRNEKRRSKSSSSSSTTTTTTMAQTVPNLTPANYPAHQNVLSHPHYPVQHHYVQQTEKLIIETRKLSVVESVSCNLPPPGSQSGLYQQQHHHQTIPGCQPACNINYQQQQHGQHHQQQQPGTSSSSSAYAEKQNSSIGDNYAAMNQSTTISNLLSQAGTTTPSLKLHCQSDMQNSNTAIANNINNVNNNKTRRKHKKKHRKKRKHKTPRPPPPLTSVDQYPMTNANLSSQTYPGHLSGYYPQIYPQQLPPNHQPGYNHKIGNCGSVTSSSSSSGTSRSSSSSSSSSDSECETGNHTSSKLSNNPYENYRRKVKLIKKSRHNSSFSSDSMSNSRRSSASSSSCSSSNSRSSSSSSSSSSCDSSSSNEGDSKSYCSRSSSSGSSSSSSSSKSSKSSSNSSNSCTNSSNEGGDILNRISFKSHDEMTQPEFFLNESISNVPLVNDIINDIITPAVSSCLVPTSFSMDTILQQQQQQQQLAPNNSCQLTATLSSTTATLEPTSLTSSAPTTSISKQNTPLSSVQSDDYNSIESPMSVGSSGKDSGKDDSGKSNVKRRDPAEERKRLRSFRLPHHLSQNKAAILTSQSATVTTTTSIATTVTTTATTVSTASIPAISDSVLSTSSAQVTAKSGIASQKVSEKPNASSKDSAKKERTVSKTQSTDSNPLNVPAKKSTPASVASATKPQATLLQTSQQQAPGNFFSSFLVPGGTSAFPGYPHYPFPANFMPLFNNQFVNTKNATNVASVANQNRYYQHSAQSQQSQLTIFTSPTLGSGAGAANALSPFSFPGVGPLTHSALLSPTFSSSGLQNAGTTTPLLVPKSLNFSPNLSFPAGGASIDPATAAAHSLMMFGFPTSKVSTQTSTPSSSSMATHHTPPFILPRIITSSTSAPSSQSSNVVNSLSSTLTSTSKSSRSKQDSRNSSGAKAQSAAKLSVPVSSTLLMASPSSSNNNSMTTSSSQHSPLSAILQPQTLYLLQSPIASSASFQSPKSQPSSTITTSPITSIKALDNRLISSPKVISATNNQSVPFSTQNLSSGANKVVSSHAATAASMSPSSLRQAPLHSNQSALSNFIFAPTSPHPHLPYTLFSQSPPQALMQPISIQAPPPQPPSSLLGTQLLLSVISPTNRNQLANFGAQFNLANNMVQLSKSADLSKTKAAAAASTTISPANSKSNLNNKPSTTASLVTIVNTAAAAVPKTTNLLSQNAPSTSTSSDIAISTVPVVSSPSLSIITSNSATTAPSVDSNPISPLFSSPSSTSSTKSVNLKEFYPTLNENVYKDQSPPVFPAPIPRTLIGTNSSSKVIRDSRVPPIPSHLSSGLSSSSTKSLSYLLPKLSTDLPTASKSSKPTKTESITSPVAGVDEFESLVRSVKDTIKSFKSSSEFFEDEEEATILAKKKKKEKTLPNDSFNSKKMLSLMLKSDEKPTKKPNKDSKLIGNESNKSKDTALKVDDKLSNIQIKIDTKHCLDKMKTVDEAINKSVVEINEKEVVEKRKDKKSRKHSKKDLDSKENFVKSKNSLSDCSALVTNDRQHKTKKKIGDITDSVNESTAAIVVAGDAQSEKKRKKHKDKHKLKDKKKESTSGSKGAKRLDKSRHKKDRKKRSRTKLLRAQDPILLSQLENMIAQFKSMTVGSGSQPSTASSKLPPMFRITFPAKISSKMANRCGRLFGIHKNDQCLLPLKKRHHRNPVEETQQQQQSSVLVRNSVNMSASVCETSNNKKNVSDECKIVGIAGTINDNSKATTSSVSESKSNGTKKSAKQTKRSSNKGKLVPTDEIQSSQRTTTKDDHINDSIESVLLLLASSVDTPVIADDGNGTSIDLPVDTAAGQSVDILKPLQTTTVAPPRTKGNNNQRKTKVQLEQKQSINLASTPHGVVAVATVSGEGKSDSGCSSNRTAGGKQTRRRVTVSSNKKKKKQTTVGDATTSVSVVPTLASTTSLAQPPLQPTAPLTITKVVTSTTTTASSSTTTTTTTTTSAASASVQTGNIKSANIKIKTTKDTTLEVIDFVLSRAKAGNSRGRKKKEKRKNNKSDTSAAVVVTAKISAAEQQKKEDKVLDSTQPDCDDNNKQTTNQCDESTFPLSHHNRQHSLDINNRTSTIDDAVDADDEFDDSDSGEQLLSTTLNDNFKQVHSPVIVKKKRKRTNKKKSVSTNESNLSNQIEMAKVQLVKSSSKQVRKMGTHLSIESKGKKAPNKLINNNINHNNNKVLKQVNNDETLTQLSRINDNTKLTVQLVNEENGLNKLETNVELIKATKPPVKVVNTVKRKRRRPVNRTGFDKPRKRAKPVLATNKKAAIIAKSVVNVVPIATKLKNDVLNSVDRKRTMPSHQGISGDSSQSELDTPDLNKKVPIKVKPKLSSTTKSNSGKKKKCSIQTSSTEIDEEVEPSSILVLPQSKKSSLSKSRLSKNSNAKAKRSHKKSVKCVSDSDSDRLVTQTSSSSQEDDDNEEENISFLTDDYPIYMVSKPSKASTQTNKKVFPIKSNPFIRSIPTKKYYKVGLHCKDFARLHSTTEDEQQQQSAANSNNDNLVNNNNSLEHNVQSDEMTNIRPILPFPPTCVSQEVISSMSSSASSQEDEENETTKFYKRKYSKRLKSTHNMYRHLHPQLAKSSLKPEDSDFNADFRLSFDIWYQYKFNPLPSLMSSANYRRVRQNVFVDRKPHAQDSQQACHCVAPKDDSPACTSDCINRLMYQECWPLLCPAGNKCSNQRIQRHDWSPGLERFMTSKRGWGIRTTEPVKSGEFILEYIGEIVSDHLFKRRMTERYRNDQHHYCLKIDAGMVIDGYRVGNEGRFVNHSCEPNCEMQKWAVNGYYRICMFALRDIEPDEELFYDYNFHNFNVDSQQVCHCGSCKCRGFIGGRRNQKSAIAENSSANSSDAQTSQVVSSKKSLKSSSSGRSKNIPLINTNVIESSTNCSKPILLPNAPFSKEFIFVRHKRSKVEIPISKLLNNGLQGYKRKPPCPLKLPNESTFECSYDPAHLKPIKPLSYSLKISILKSRCFLIRNYEHFRKLTTTLLSVLEPNSGKDNNGCSFVNDYETHSIVKTNRIRQLGTDSQTSANSSDNESSNGRNIPSNGSSDLYSFRRALRTLMSGMSTNSSVRTRGFARAESDDNISRTVQLAQIFTDICFEVRSLVKDKLTSLMVVKDEVKPLNGGTETVHNGTLKRSFSQMCFLDSKNSLFSFNTIIERIQSGQFLQSEFFESEMIKYIHDQLQLLQFQSKKLKLGNDKVSDSIKNYDSIDYESMALNHEDMQKLEQNILNFLAGILKEKKVFIDSIIKHNENGLLDKGKLSRLMNEMGKLDNNNLHLNEENKEKLSNFVGKLNSVEPIKLSETTDANRAIEAVLFSKKVHPVVPVELANKQNGDITLQNGFGPREEIVRCICGITREEGNMIQCDQCEIWQHMECVEQFSDLTEHKDYLCEACQPRHVPNDIPLPKPNIPNLDVNNYYSIKYYLTLDSPVVKGLRIKVGDCVYIYRKSSTSALPIKPRPNKKKGTDTAKVEQNLATNNFLETIKEAANSAIKNLGNPFQQRECIIIRVQHLAIIETTGQRILFGHHYLWPSETYHEPSRKFFKNEVLRSPLCEWAAIEEVRNICAVLDPTTYVKGRPLGFKPDDIFICELRVDRDAKSFSRIPKAGHCPVNTKGFAFEKFDTKLSMKRTYSPHQIPESFKKGQNIKSNNKKDEITEDNADTKSNNNNTGENSAELAKKKSENDKIRQNKMIKLLKITNCLNEVAYCRLLLSEQAEQKNTNQLLKQDDTTEDLKTS